MRTITFYPNCCRGAIFKEFDKGKRPAELIKLFTNLKPQTIMSYFGVWKPIGKPKVAMIKTFIAVAEAQIDRNEIKNIEDYVDTRINPAITYLYEQPYDWFSDKSIEEVLKILNRQPWRWEAPL